MKTIKDIKFIRFGKGETLIPINQLKQEAIEHIKHYQKYIDDPLGKFNEGTKLTNLLGLGHTIRWIKHFFNIEERDLK